nr:reverse transcriptase domain-containing protein [Tanacetum cinerariifolium]
TTPRVNIQEFCEEYYEDILPIIMHKVRRDRRKDVHTRLDFKEGPRERTREDSHHSSARARTTKPERLRVQDCLKYGDRHVLNQLDSRDHPWGRSRPHRLDTSNEDFPKDRERFHSVGESYDDSFSHSCRDKNRSRHMKRKRDNESPLSSVSKSDSSEGRVWFDELPLESIDSYKDLKAAFLAYFMQQKKYVKDPVEIHNIKQKGGETIEDFMKRFKVETGRMKGAPECMQIFRFMHGVNNPELTKRLNEHVPKIMEEMMIATTIFIRGKADAASKKKGHTSWKVHDHSKRQTSEKRSDFWGHSREGRESNRFTPLTRTGKRDSCSRGREIQAVPSTAHGMLKFPVEGGIVTIRSTILIPTECTSVITSSAVSKEERTRPDNFKVALHPDFPDQEVAIGVTLSEKGGTKLCSILKKNLDIFAWKPSDMTGVPRSVAEYRINIREGYSPVRQKKRGQAPERAKAIQAEVQKLVEAGIMIEVYYHDWLSNLAMVKKHNGSWRMCVDFTDLNKACPQDCYPLPEIDWKVESLCGYPFKCFLDAYKGYHQIQLAEPDKEKTTFHIRQGVYCYTKMPFGLKNTGATYQRLMDKAFDSQIGQNIKVYVNDLVVKSYIEAEMLRVIDETFRTLRKINMKLNPKKCTFGVAEGVFLGHVVTPDGIKPCPNKTSAVLQLPSPRTIKEVQSLNEKLASLNRFLSKSKEKTAEKMKYHARRTQYYIQAKNVSQKTDLSSFSYRNAGRKPTSRASGRNSTRAVDTFHGRLIMYGLVRCGAYTDKPGGNRASNNEAEYEALIAGLRIAAQMGVQNVHVSVDSKLVANQVLGTYVAKEENMVNYLDKVKSLVRGFTNFSISQVPRSKNKKVDALSKIVSASFAHLSKQIPVEVLKAKSIKEKEVTTMVEEDGPTWMTPIVEYLKEGTLPIDRREARKLRIKTRQYKLIKGILYRRSFLTPWLRCVGPLQAEYVIREIHEGSCIMHAGLRSVVAKAIRLGYYWPTMHQDAYEMIRKCNDCGPFLEGPGKVKFLIVAMDYFMKWIEAKAVATITGGQVKKFVWDNFVCRFGLPGEIVSNNEIGMPTYRTAVVDVVSNDEELQLNLDLLEEQRERATICEAKANNDASHAVVRGNLGPKWEGPYEVTEALGDEAYKLRSMDGTILPRTWNIANLKRCYL